MKLSILGCNHVTRGACLLTKQKTEETVSYEERSLYKYIDEKVNDIMRTLQILKGRASEGIIKVKRRTKSGGASLEEGSCMDDIVY